MPRIKTNPTRRSSSSRHRMEQDVDEADESVLDDEEVRRLERELEFLRREKSQQIRRMKENRRKRGSPESSSDSDAYCPVSDSHQVENEPRDSTRSLVNGIDRVQKRFRFNVRRIEEKFVERERAGLLETHIEMDNRGVFFFPERMAPVHQQNFVNKMYQRDAQFGKGSVSAPRNSIEVFDGDVRAMRKAQMLDVRFGKKLRRSQNGLEGRNPSSLVDVTLRTSRSSFKSSSSFREELDDDVFDDSVNNHRRQPHSSRIPSTSTMASFFDERSTIEEEDREFADDEEDSEDGSEDMTDEEEEKEEEEVTPIASRRVTPESSVPKVPKTEMKIENVTPVRSVKQETVPDPSSSRKQSDLIVPIIKKEALPVEVVTRREGAIETTPNLRRNKKITEFLRPIDESVPPPVPPNPPIPSASTIRAPATPSQRRTRSSVTPIAPEANGILLKDEVANEEKVTVESTEPKPVRKRKPTEKMVAAMYQHHHESSSKKNKEPYCKHCELLKEEKKLGKQKKSEEIVEESKSQKKSKVSAKRRSATAGVEEPETKKKKLADSDLLSIPSSLAVIVDTELIAAENDLSAAILPMFADSSTCSSSSIWNTSVDSELLKEMSQSKKSAKFFGVPLDSVTQNSRLINVWVDNLERAPRDKDTFSQDFRRALAQSKKARSDGKAGYDIGRRST